MLLDTNACIALLKGDRAMTKWVKAQDAGALRLCSVVKAELLFGAYKSKRRADNIAVVRTLFTEFESLPFDDGAADHYGQLRAILAAQGTPIGANDMLIASIALTHALPLVTRNTDEFSRIPGLALVDW